MKQSPLGQVRGRGRRGSSLLPRRPCPCSPCSFDDQRNSCLEIEDQRNSCLEIPRRGLHSVAHDVEVGEQNLELTSTSIAAWLQDICHVCVYRGLAQGLCTQSAQLITSNQVDGS